MSSTNRFRIVSKRVPPCLSAIVRPRVLSIVVIVSVIIVFVAFVHATDNLVVNGSFEITAASGMPLGWKRQKSGNATLSLDQTSYLGSNAMTLETHESYDAPEPYMSSEVAGIVQTIPIKPKSHYLLSFWYKFDRTSTDELKFFVFGEPDYLPSSMEWRRAIKLFESGHQHSLDLLIQIYRRTSKVWIDEVTLTEVAPITNYLANGCFEAVREDNTPAGWTVTKVGSPTVDIEASGLYGARCLTLKGHPTSDSPPNYPTSEIARVAQAVPLKQSTPYTLSFWYRTKDLSDLFKIEILNEQYYLNHSTEWAREVINIHSGDRRETVVKFLLYRRTGEVWVDHVDFSEAIQ